MGDVVTGRRNVAQAKGLKKDALSFVSNVTIALSSTSPAYSIAATLGPITGFAALATPSIMVMAFVPMLFIAVACYHLNRADPDCGTTFSWVTRANHWSSVGLVPGVSRFHWSMRRRARA